MEVLAAATAAAVQDETDIAPPTPLAAVPLPAMSHAMDLDCNKWCGTFDAEICHALNGDAVSSLACIDASGPMSSTAAGNLVPEGTPMMEADHVDIAE